ncbi:efflux RND transporter periplasmic adaptor subunit [Sapientia aquatica]|uniref:Efflux RND transporter periplasmic adaptor subunit n=1 Tax=Sapientia aquatica TaxID=1549640 RepID=A0A4R5VX86_9BURK|nr:efflux RND transporter periplasmic adaptor subunit [Sapientia aquatica]TDK63520.1 efflux RND transporter periplasmic adaptor subunit [Sapientia aquatica]
MRTEQAQSPSIYPNQRKTWLWLVIAVALVGGAAALWKYKSAPEAGVAASPKGNKSEVVFELADTDIASIIKRELNVNLLVSGSLIPQNNITVKSKVTAVVSETMVQEGMAVSEGQVLAKFDNADLAARLATQDAAVEESTTKLELAKKNRESSHALFLQKYISQNAFDTSENALQLAQANLKSTMSQREVARLALADTIIRAPMSGIVSKRLVQAGEKVSPDTPLFSLVNLSKLILEAPVPASEIPRIKLGQPVSFAVDGFAARQFKGKVVRINPNAETGTRSFMVYIEVLNDDAVLRGGMFAKGQITLEKSTKTTLVPLIAVRQVSGVPTVYKIDHDHLVAQAVELGLRNEDEGYAEVKKGLVEGDQVIVSQLDMVKPGSKVTLPAAKKTSAATKG